MKEILKAFYKQYDYRVIKKTYKSTGYHSAFSHIYRIIPFNVEIRMKNDVFAMQLTSDGVVSMELMTLIGYFFEKYSEKSNCVWTKNEKKIIEFFSEGISKFTNFGGKITFGLLPENIDKIVGLLYHQNRDDDPGFYSRLCKEFNHLEAMNWHEYQNLIKTELETERKEKHIADITSMDLPLDWSNSFSSDESLCGVYAQSAADGLVLSLNNLGRVDIEYISQITGVDCKTVISDLYGSIYQNPEKWEECFYKGWETADEYLSGRVVDKWEKAREANRAYNGYFQNNVKALDKVIPKSVATEDIYVTLGSPWIPADVIDEFIKHILGSLHCYTDNKGGTYAVSHDEASGIWEIKNKPAYKGTVKSNSTYGTKRLEAIYILEKTLNMKAVVVTDEVPSVTNKSGKKRVINKAETVLAQEKQQKMIEAFKSWVWADKARKDRLQLIYSKKFCSNVIRHYDGSFLSFPQMNPAEKLFDYQKNAVARIMFSPNTLLAHEVGAGKTYVMAAAGMEMRRIGISKKNLYVVPNNLVGQWKSIFLKLYPDARLLCIEPNGFKKEKREAMLKKIRDNDYDGIIMAYSCFELVPVSKQNYITELELKKNAVNRVINQKSKGVQSNKIKESALQSAVCELTETLEDIYNTVYFDELGINTMFVDEAHNFKNVPIESKISYVLGLSLKGSARCRDMMDKVRLVQAQNDGRGVVFATGTPVTNSLTDIFVMQKYLQSGELALLDLQSFDSWIGMFAETESNFEVDVDTNSFRMATRFSKYNNMPELTNILADITDYYGVSKENGIPQMVGYKDIVISKTDELNRYLAEISDRADDVRKGFVKRTDDNMLKITTDGRLAALDLRLVNGNAGFSYQSKVAHCVENVFEIYTKTKKLKSTQLIFCDSSTPKDGFNIYDETKRLLINMGVVPEHIAYIHDATSESRRNALFLKVQSGEIRILIGSTFKLGLGVNVQNKLVALHHLDVPWRPADMVQREGRILRRGNENKKVEIYRYITDGSFDAYSWQLLETKQKMISSVLSGVMSDRICADVDDAILNYAEVKALAIGNPLLKKRVETANELTKNLTLQRKYIEVRQAMEVERTLLPEKIERQKSIIANCKTDMEYYSKCKREYTKKERKTIRQLISDALGENLLSVTESTVCKYQGFDIVIPGNLIKDKLYLYVQNCGRYYVEMGQSQSGILTRIDNFLDTMDTHLQKLNSRLEHMEQRKEDIKAELQKDEDYLPEISRLKAELANIDKKLGVKR